MNQNRANLDLRDIHQQPQEALFLYSTVFAHRPTHIFEVGSYKGGSAKIIATAMLDAGLDVSPAHLFLIDPEPRFTPENAEFLDGKVTVVAAPSPSAYSELPKLSQGFSMCFIDGDHAEDAVYADIVHATPYLSPGALILCHDSFYVPTLRGIERAARSVGLIDCGEMVKDPVKTDQFEGDYLVAWGGLRLLRKPW